jgi:quaternary ammonium compound-resistance protein SugE
MPWLVLVASALLEAVWATALSRTDHFTQPVATTVFLLALAGSMAGLSWAAGTIPIGTAYAVWTGLGASLTFGYAMLAGDEPVSIAKVLFLNGIIIAVIGLKLMPARPRPAPTSATTLTRRGAAPPPPSSPGS